MHDLETRLNDAITKFAFLEEDHCRKHAQRAKQRSHKAYPGPGQLLLQAGSAGDEQPAGRQQPINGFNLGAPIGQQVQNVQSQHSIELLFLLPRAIDRANGKPDIGDTIVSAFLFGNANHLARNVGGDVFFDEGRMMQRGRAGTAAELQDPHIGLQVALSDFQFTRVYLLVGNWIPGIFGRDPVPESFGGLHGNILARDFSVQCMNSLSMHS